MRTVVGAEYQPEPLRIQVENHSSGIGDRDLAGFFRDDHAERVSNFAYADRRPMPRSQVGIGQITTGGDRQDA